MKTFNKILLALVAIFCFSMGLSASEAPQDTDVKWMLRVNVRMANIRSGPGLEQSIVRQLPQNTLLPAMEKQGEWYLVLVPATPELPEIEAFIHESTIEVVNTLTGKKETPDDPSKAAEQSSEQVEQKSKTEPVSRTRPQPEIHSRPEYKKIYISAGFHAGFQEENPNISWTESIYHEDANSSLSYQVQAGTPITAAVGFRFSHALGIEAGVDISSRDMAEGYSSSIPHPLYFSAARQGEGVENGSLTENTAFLNLVYTLRFGNLGMELFGGPAYIMAEAAVISGMTFSESYPYESIALSAETTNISQNVFGFNGGAQLVYFLGETIAVHAGARYISGQASFEPENGFPGPEITLGGLRAGGGIKIYF
jgi:hypothetical protein